MMSYVLVLALAAGVAGLLLVGAAYEEWSRRSSAQRFPPRGRLVDIGGRRLHLMSKGTDGPTVVVEQGAGGPALSWLELQAEIARFATVCLYDRAGYFWSDAVPGHRTLDFRVEDLRTALTAAALPGPYILVGHSYGGFLIRLFARNYPEDVAGLVFVDAPHEHAYFQREVLSLYTKFGLMLRAMAFLAPFGVPRLLSRVMSKNDPTSAELNAGMARREYFLTASDDVTSLKRAASWLRKPDALGSLGDLPIAVITHGQPFPGPFAVLEKSWREGQDRLASLSSDSEFFVAEKANHMIHNDQPEIVVAAIRSVLMRARSRSSINALSTDASSSESDAACPATSPHPNP